MRTIIFIGSQKSGSSREAIQAADRLGFFTVVFTNQRITSIQRAEFPDIHQMVSIDLNNKEEMRKKIRRLQEQGKTIEAIVSFVDPYVHTAALLCKEFCSKEIPTEAILKMENKIQTRLALQNTEFGIKHAVYDTTEMVDSFMKRHNLDYPIIVKSPGSTGSKDVLKADNESELENHVAKLQNKYLNAPILFEEYIDGPQYLVEVLVYNNTIYLVAIVEQEISKKERFIITGYSLLAQVSEELYESILKTVHSIIDTLQFTNGSCHFEMRYHTNHWKIIEINPRIAGGAMNRMIDAAYGINLVEQIIKMSLGQEPCLEKKHERFTFTQYITLSTKGTLQKVTGRKRALQHPGVEHVYIRPRKGAQLHPPLSMGHRYAYVLASASTKEEAKKRAKAAAKELKFHLA